MVSWYFILGQISILILIPKKMLLPASITVKKGSMQTTAIVFMVPVLFYGNILPVKYHCQFLNIIYWYTINIKWNLPFNSVDVIMLLCPIPNTLWLWRIICCLNLSQIIIFFYTKIKVTKAFCRIMKSWFSDFCNMIMKSFLCTLLRMTKNWKLEISFLKDSIDA